MTIISRWSNFISSLLLLCNVLQYSARIFTSNLISSWNLINKCIYKTLFIPCTLNYFSIIFLNFLTNIYLLNFTNIFSCFRLEKFSTFRTTISDDFHSRHKHFHCEKHKKDLTLSRWCQCTCFTLTFLYILLWNSKILVSHFVIGFVIRLRHAAHLEFKIIEIWIFSR